MLLKIWEKATTSPDGLVVRDAYRHVKALQRRAKELGRNVAAYTIDLYYQLEKMGKGVVQRCGRLVKFVVGTTNLKTTPLSQDPKGVTVETDAQMHSLQALQVSRSQDVSPVTVADFAQLQPSSDVNETIELLPLDQNFTPLHQTSAQQYLTAETLINQELEPVGATTNSLIIPPTAPIPPRGSEHEIPTQELKALILQCQTWVELVQCVGENASSLIMAVKNMTQEERFKLPRLLADHLCFDPTYLSKLAWLPVKLRNKALEQLMFTIQRIGGASLLDACVEYVSDLTFAEVVGLGTKHENWIFQTPNGEKLTVVGVDTITAICLQQRNAIAPAL